MDVSSSLELNHVKSVCCATVHVIALYLFVICYSLHEIYYQLLSECMLSLVYSSMEYLLWVELVKYYVYELSVFDLRQLQLQC